jgi:molybdopterin converting factor small subunit
MKIEVQLFAGARKIAGSDAVWVEVPDGSDVSGLRSALCSAHPGLAVLLPGSRFAVNLQFADEQAPLPRDAEIALIPPVSGG